MIYQNHFFPLSTKCDITSSFVGKSDTIETKAPKNLFPGVVEPEFTKSEEGEELVKDSR